MAGRRGCESVGCLCVSANVSVFVSKNQTALPCEQETRRAGKGVWDPGKGTGQTEGP